MINITTEPYLENIQNFVYNTWSGDVSFIETEGVYDNDTLSQLDCFLKDYPQYIEGIPFPGDDDLWDDLSITNIHAIKLQELVNNFE